MVHAMVSLFFSMASAPIVVLMELRYKMAVVFLGSARLDMCWLVMVLVCQIVGKMRNITLEPVPVLMGIS